MIIKRDDSRTFVDERDNNALALTLRNLAKELADEYFSTRTTSEIVHGMARTAIFEFLKNTLHGKEIELAIMSAGDGTGWISTKNEVDHGELIDEGLCLHRGIAIIVGIMGQENYSQAQTEHYFFSQLHLVPNRVTEMAAA